MTGEGSCDVALRKANQKPADTDGPWAVLFKNPQALCLQQFLRLFSLWLVRQKLKKTKLWSYCAYVGTGPTDFILSCCPRGSSGWHVVCIVSAQRRVSVYPQIFAQCILVFPIFFGRLRKIHLCVHTESSLTPSARWSLCTLAQLPYHRGADI